MSFERVQAQVTPLVKQLFTDARKARHETNKLAVEKALLLYVAASASIPDKLHKALREEVRRGDTTEARPVPFPTGQTYEWKVEP